MCKNNLSSVNSSNWIWRVGVILGVLGAIEGAVAALVFAWAQYKNLPPGLQFLMNVTSQDNGFRFTLVMIAGFVLSGILTLLSTISKRFSKLFGVIVLALGLALTVLSVLTSFSIGGFTFYGAIFVLLGGVLIIVASWLQSL